MARNHIHEISERLNALYQAVSEDRRRLQAAEWERADSFSVLGEIEVLTTDVQGYGSWIIKPGSVKNPEKVLAELHKRRIEAIPHLSDWFFSSDNSYPGIKDYVETVDYLRMLLMEYISTFQGADHVGGERSPNVLPDKGITDVFDSRTHQPSM